MNKNLKLSEIRIDGQTQVRVQLNQEKVKEYADQMKDGTVFDPMEVTFDGSTHWLTSGFHRYFAYKTNGALEAECIVSDGSLRDAQWAGFGSNRGNGEPLNKEDLKAATTRIFNDEEWGQLSNREIAKHLGRSAMTIGRYRKDWEEARQEETGEQSSGEVTYTNKHGQKATMNVSKSKKKDGKKEDKKTDSKDVPKTDGKDAPKDTGAPAKMTKEEELSQKLLELEETLAETINENERLKDAVATGQYDASDIEKMDVEMTIKELREQVRVKDIEINSLRESRDTYQNRAAELQKLVKTLQNKLKKAGIE